MVISVRDARIAKSSRNTRTISARLPQWEVKAFCHSGRHIYETVWHPSAESLERKFGWLGRWWRQSKDYKDHYEELPEITEAMVTLGHDPRPAPSPRSPELQTFTRLIT
jgi:hypothetical protein